MNLLGIFFTLTCAALPAANLVFPAKRGIIGNLTLMLMGGLTGAVSVLGYIIYFGHQPVGASLRDWMEHLLFQLTLDGIVLLFVQLLVLRLLVGRRQVS